MQEPTVIGNAIPTMNSIQLLVVVNQARGLHGESEIRRNDFTARCMDELVGENYETFVVKNPNGTESEAINMTRDQCMYVLMRESKAVRRTATECLNKQAAPAALSTMDILQIAIGAEKGRLAAVAQLAIAAPKVAFVEQYVESTGLKGFRQVAKLLKIKEPVLRSFLEKEEVMYRLGGEWVAYQRHIDAGRFEVKTGSAEISGHAFNRSMFTPKGVEWLAGLWAVHCLGSEVAA